MLRLSMLNLPLNGRVMSFVFPPRSVLSRPPSRRRLEVLRMTREFKSIRPFLFNIILSLSPFPSFLRAIIQNYSQLHNVHVMPEPGKGGPCACGGRAEARARFCLQLRACARPSQFPSSQATKRAGWHKLLILPCSCPCRSGLTTEHSNQSQQNFVSNQICQLSPRTLYNTRWGGVGLTLTSPCLSTHWLAEWISGVAKLVNPKVNPFMFMSLLKNNPTCLIRRCALRRYWNKVRTLVRT